MKFVTEAFAKETFARNPFLALNETHPVMENEGMQDLLNQVAEGDEAKRLVKKYVNEITTEFYYRTKAGVQRTRTYRIFKNLGFDVKQDLEDLAMLNQFVYIQSTPIARLMLLQMIAMDESIGIGTRSHFKQYLLDNE